MTTSMGSQPMEYGRYRVVAVLGQGGMGAVYRGHDPVLDRAVAIKVVGRDLLGDIQAVERFRREARTLAALHHPTIVQIYDFGEQGGEQYMVMELVEGVSLADYARPLMAAGRRMVESEVVAVLVRVAEALDVAHAQGIVHRDIKPANVLLRGGRVTDAVLADFGLVMILNRVSQATLGQSFGTPDYIAPEQALQSSAASPLSDIYSLGVMAYALLTGALPFEADSPIDLALKHLNEAPRAPRLLNPALPEAVERVLLRALEKDPSKRYQTAGEFAAALRDGFAPGVSAARGALPVVDATTPGTAPVRSATQVPPATPGAAGRSAAQVPGTAAPGPGSAPARSAAQVPSVASVPVPLSTSSASPTAAGGAAMPAGLPRWAVVGGAVVAVVLLGSVVIGGLMQAVGRPGAATATVSVSGTGVPGATGVPGTGMPAATSVPTEAVSTATPVAADPVALLTDLQTQITTAKENGTIKGKAAKELADRVEAMLNAVNGSNNREGFSEAYERFTDYLDEHAPKDVPAELAAAWLAQAQAVRDAVGGGN